MDMIDTVQRGAPRIAFLNHVVDILLRRMAREPRTHGPLVGNDMLCHPRGHAAPPLDIHVLRREFSSPRSEEHTSELQSLMRISYAVFCLKKKTLMLLHTSCYCSM